MVLLFWSNDAFNHFSNFHIKNQFDEGQWWEYQEQDKHYKSELCRGKLIFYVQLKLMSWDDRNRLKFSGKTNRLKISLIFTILANFVYFFNISDRNLIILYKFTWKLPCA